MPKLALPRVSPTTKRVSAGRFFASVSRQRLAQPRHGLLNEPWLPPASVSPLPTTYFFSPTRVRRELDGPGPLKNDHKPPDERTLKLGEIAWSSIPLVGNVKLQILSERIVRSGTLLDPTHHGSHHDCGDERLIVRWKTEPRTESGPFHSPASSSNTATSSPDTQTNPLSGSTKGTNKGLSMLLGGDEPIFKLSQEDQFDGLFIFSFDEEGRILTHTIEHADQADGWDRTAKFVTLTDWLIGKARGSLDPVANPGLAMETYQNQGFAPGNRRRRSVLN
ncbi:uncharacterized protein N7515_000160 [Penicillium bovifimosum]|uniref:Uncharacterized protein n=1 Tax=Penicillium bovifimosum TaxID=126998 RepID=A0A9W9HEG7_9EURO|nr:uncharacterized protein N7515_000160 [Penicillium bovifimosum]KAJ5145596.1 hypothetical protein N7515_000160 [Penicillium bovifimosum]